MLLLFALSCSDYGLKGKPPGSERGPDIEVEPGALDLVVCGEEASALTIRNVGDASLVLSAVTLEGGGWEADTRELPDSLAAGEEFQRQVPDSPGRGRLVDEVEARLTGRVDQLLHRVHERARAGGGVPCDIIELDVAEGAAAPITAVRDHELVPAAVGPQPMRGVECVHDLEVAVQRQAAVVGRERGGVVNVGVLDTPLPGEGAMAAVPSALQVVQPGEEGAFAVVEREGVDTFPQARLGGLAQLGVHVAAAQEHERAPGTDPLSDT